MNLTFDQIKTVATGVMEFIEENGLWLYRFNEAQRAVYSHQPNNLYQSRQAAGITLDLHTDATAIRMTVDGERDYDNVNRAFDLLIDGNFVCSVDTLGMDCAIVGKKLTPYGPYDLLFRLPKGEKRVTVVMPWDATVRIRSMELENATFFRPAEFKRTMIAFGDSITHGAYAKYACMTYAMQTARLLDAKLYNFGIGGERFRMKKIIKGSYPECDFVTVAYGTNDYAHQPEEAFEEKMPSFFAQLKDAFPDTPIFVILPLWRILEGYEERKALGSLQDVRDRIAKECEKYPNITVLDGSKWVPHMKEFYGDKTLLHPNDLGMSQYAMGLTKAILQHL